MQKTDTSEKSIEDIIEAWLSSKETGYRISYSTDYNKEHCIIPKLLFEFLQNTQPEAYKKIRQRGTENFLNRLNKMDHFHLNIELMILLILSRFSYYK